MTSEAKDTNVRVDISWFAQNVNGEYRYTRKMYPQHKNMQSGGFTLGDGSIANKYLNRPTFRQNYREELLAKLQNAQQVDYQSAPIIKSPGSLGPRDSPTFAKPRPIRVSATRTPEAVRDQSPVYESRPGPALPSRRPFEEVLTRRTNIGDSPFRVAGQQSLVGGPRAKSVTPIKQAPLQPLSMPLVSRNVSGSTVHELASNPLFQAPKFTKRNPKVHLDNPITGLPPDYPRVAPI